MAKPEQNQPQPKQADAYIPAILQRLLEHESKLNALYSAVAEIVDELKKRGNGKAKEEPILPGLQPKDKP